jgi:two-component system chemotaxis sensor kinase CheA
MPVPFDASRFIDQYKAETRERLDRASDILLSAEVKTEPSCLTVLIREFHTIKGSASMMGLQSVSQLAHKLEDVVSTAQSQANALTDSEISSLLQSIDELRELLEHGDGTQVGEQQEQKPGRASMRVSAARLRDIADRASQIIGLRGIMDELSASLRECCELVSTQSEKWRNLQEQVGYIDRVQAGRFGGALDELASTVGGFSGLRHVLERVQDRYDDLADRIKSAASDICTELLSLEMVSISVLGNLLRRSVRDIAERQGKKIDFRFDGADVKVNRMVVDELSESLLHLARNAADHGIETPSRRREAGKPEVATISLSAVSEGEHVRLTLEDDGRGLDLEMIERRARELGLIQDELDASVKSRVAAFVFAEGFSTKQVPDEISGRGIGLGIVRRKIESIGGTVHLESAPGTGCRFTMLIPSAAFLVRSLVCTVGEHAVCIPVAHVGSVVRGDQAEWLSIAGRTMVRLDGSTYPLLTVYEMAGVSASEVWDPGDRCDLVTVRVLDRALVLAVDRVVDEAEILVKPLGKLFRSTTAFSGAALLSEGRIGLVMSVSALSGHVRDMARGLLTPVDQGSAEGTGEGVRRRGVKPRILVLDDSLTSRELLRSVLEAEGFETVGAHDGADALNKLLTTPVDLVLTDIEMPGIDGFALCERIRGGDAAYCDTPIVVVTTRDRQEDRRRGLEAGASAYVVKKAFNQEDLLGTIDRLLSRGDWG